MDTKTLQAIIDCLHSQANETFNADVSIALDEVAGRLEDVIREEEAKQTVVED